MTAKHAPSDGTSPWSVRTIELAGILKPYLNIPLTRKHIEELRDKLRPFYKGRRVAEQTCRTLLHRLQNNSLDGLERKRHRDQGQSTLPLPLVQYIRDLLITKKLSKRKIQEKAQEYARDVLELSGEHPTYDQILFIDARIPRYLKTLAQDGVRAYRNQHEIVERFEAEYAHQLAHADNHRLDIYVRDPLSGHEFRPWLTAILDDQSRAIVGISISKRDPGSRGVALAFRHALLPKSHAAWLMQGIFENVYFDHGKEYLSEHITSICLHLDIHIMNHEEYHPQAKGKLEQWFDTLEEDCLSDKDGYMGKLANRKRRTKARYTMDELLAIIITWILEKYHERVHSETGMAPRKRWLASANQRVIRSIDASNERNLDFLLKSEPRRISKLGIRKDHHDYVDPEYYLENYIGDSVRIYFDPLNPSWVHVYRVDDLSRDLAYLCTAYQRGVRVMDDADRREIAAARRDRRQPKQAEARASKQRVAEIEKAESTRKQQNGTRQSKSPNQSVIGDSSEPAPSIQPRVNDPSQANPTSRVTVLRLDAILQEYADGDDE